MPTPPSCLFCCVDEETHVGRHLLHAARAMGLPATYLNNREAFQSSPWVRRMNWWLLGRRPSRLRQYSEKVLATCRQSPPNTLVATGLAPIRAAELRAIGQLGVKRVNYLTDDPWNPAHRSAWFLAAVKEYDCIYTTRRANLGDLQRHGCKRVEYLPFAYAPEEHFPEPPTPAEREKYACDLSFIGGADADRVPYLEMLLKAGLRVKVYGGYWDKWPSTRACWGGFVLGAELRKAVAGSKICLCLVRQANRDGHVMRTFELAAMGACILAEDTIEHREIYGPPEAGRVCFFQSREEMAQRAVSLLADEPRREGMKAAALARVTRGGQTYRDRLEVLINAKSPAMLAS